MQRVGKVITFRNKLAEVSCLPGTPAFCKNCNKGCSESGVVILVEVPESLGRELSVGDEVVIEIPDKSVFKSSTVLFFLPTCTLFLGILAAEMFGWGSLGSLVSSLIGLVIGIVIALTINKFVIIKPRILDVLMEVKLL